MIRIKEDIDYALTTCGLSCDLCDANTPKIQNVAKYLLKVFEDPMFLGVMLMSTPEFKKENISGFQDTLEVLKKFTPCPGCQERKDCVINQCANQKEINSCSQCEFLDLEVALCRAPPEQPKNPIMPPAPKYFQYLSERYQNWNVENLIELINNQKGNVNSKIKTMIKEGKTRRY